MNTNRLPSCLCGAIIASVGFLYFLVYAVQFLLFHLPTSLDLVPTAVLVLLFAVSIASCYLYAALSYVIEIITDEPLASESGLIKLAGTISIWATALPAAGFLLPIWSWTQLGYLVGLTAVALGHLQVRNRQSTPRSGTSLDILSIIMLALMPTMHALAGPASFPTPLATAFVKLLASNILGLVIYMLQPLEALGVPHHWGPSFHAMCLMTTLALIVYSHEVMQVLIARMA
ncbi:hypothetical protein N7478_010292 [Penicillium angulare]|uniref:uncharacterized protein n=1 Tax=Penicillium angulare TaxID=116970 RepID=UPI0025417268|nr:uncharacterized protein N7478_010292 [Penicillium angulare]KAJ5267484.1 hypothetical protein N7478_010292 [Penicillium angulare]